MSYKIIRRDVEYVVDKELRLATEKFGDKHHSYHEAYAVMLEEFEEAEEELNKCKKVLDILWQHIKDDRAFPDESLSEGVSLLKGLATDLACEAIQLAAMANKLENGVVAQGEPDE